MVGTIQEPISDDHNNHLCDGSFAIKWLQGLEGLKVDLFSIQAKAGRNCGFLPLEGLLENICLAQIMASQEMIWLLWRAGMVCVAY